MSFSSDRRSLDIQELAFLEARFVQSTALSLDDEIDVSSQILGKVRTQ
jgi:hypothetical protein